MLHGSLAAAYSWACLNAKKIDDAKKKYREHNTFMDSAVNCAMTKS